MMYFTLNVHKEHITIIVFIKILMSHKNYLALFSLPYLTNFAPQNKLIKKEVAQF